MSSLKKLEKCLYCGQLGLREDTATGTDFNHQFKGGKLYQSTVNFCFIPKAIVKGLKTK